MRALYITSFKIKTYYKVTDNYPHNLRKGRSVNRCNEQPMNKQKFISLCQVSTNNLQMHGHAPIQMN